MWSYFQSYKANHENDEVTCAFLVFVSGLRSPSAQASSCLFLSVVTKDASQALSPVPRLRCQGFGFHRWPVLWILGHVFLFLCSLVIFTAFWVLRLVQSLVIFTAFWALWLVQSLDGLVLSEYTDFP